MIVPFLEICYISYTYNLLAQETIRTSYRDAIGYSREFGFGNKHMLLSVVFEGIVS
jgi:hypothetical protein